MENMVNGIKIGLSAVMAYLFGGFDKMMELLCIAMAIDLVTGIILASVFHKSPKSAYGSLNSKTAIKGMLRKVCQLLLVVIITRLSLIVGDDRFCRNTAVLFFTAGECISILENVGLMGVTYPDWLKNALELLQRNNRK